MLLGTRTKAFRVRDTEILKDYGAWPQAGSQLSMTRINPAQYLTRPSSAAFLGGCRTAKGALSR